MSKDLRLRINFGERQFVVNCNDYTYDRVEQLSEKVSEVRQKHSLFSKYPLEEGETKEKWRERVEPLMEKDAVRKDGETPEDHLKRLFQVKPEAHEIAYEVVGVIAEVFNLNHPNELDFKKANWLEVRGFIYDVLNLGDVECSDFFPKRPLKV